MADRELTPIEWAATGQPDPDHPDQPPAGAWLDSYLDLIASGLHWKKAAFVAWSNAPKATRQPRTLRELAMLLNYQSEQVFYKWQHQPWFLEKGLDKLRQAIFQRFIGDVDRQTIAQAVHETGSPGVAARRLFYEQAKLAQPVGSENDPLHVWLHELTRLKDEGGRRKDENEDEN